MTSFAAAQRLIVSGFPFHRARHFFLRVSSVADARAFLAKCRSKVALVDQKLGSDAVSLALTRDGLEALQLPAAYLNAFARLAPGFFQGAVARGAEHLGDTGRNESVHWEPPFQNAQTHVILSIYADQVRDIVRVEQALRALGPDGLSGWNLPADGAHLDADIKKRREHFGFRDGLSQPVIAGTKENQTQRPFVVAPGEFLLGHPNTHGENVWASESLPGEVREFVANGCFGAFRKMQQHVEAFKAIPALMQAKMCGRWPNGELVRPGQTQEPAATPGGPINSFDFTHDPQGMGCPFGSHIRRLNPRSDPVNPQTPFLMRRGIPYDTGTEKGILGMFLCASLERQFEFLMRDWGRTPPMNPHHDANAIDPLIGGNSGGIFRDDSTAAPVSVPGLGKFVTTKGTLYCFLPSATALGIIGATL